LPACTCAAGTGRQRQQKKAAKDAPIETAPIKAAQISAFFHVALPWIANLSCNEAFANGAAHTRAQKPRRG